MKSIPYFFPLIALVILLSILISSCKTTNDVAASNIIQKRKYNKGYFVNIFHKRQKVSTIQTANNEKTVTAYQTVIEKACSVLPSNNNAENLIASPDSIQLIKPVLSEKKIVQEKRSNSKAEEKISKIEKKFFNPFPKAKQDDKPKINGNALAGFICSLSAPLLIFLILLHTLTLILPVISIFICLFCAIILSVKGLRQIKDDPSIWKGKVFAIIGLVLGIIELSLFLFVVIFWTLVMGFP